MRNRLRKVVAQKRYGIGVGIGAAIAAYAVSPYLALYDIDRALNSNRPGLLANHVDWTLLGNSLKDQVLPVTPVADDDLPDFGSSFAGSAISHAIDVNLSPAMLLSSAKQAMARNGGAPGVSPDWHGIHAHFVGLRKFEAQIDQPGRTPFVLHMTFEHWAWKITRFDMPGSPPLSELKTGACPGLLFPAGQRRQDSFRPGGDLPPAP